MENCNLVLSCGEKIGLKTVGVGGVDIVDGKTNLILSQLWQFLRLHALNSVKNLKKNKIEDEDGLVRWANDMVIS